MTHADGTPVALDELTDIHQEQILYDGTIESAFSTADGARVEVTTSCLPQQDAMLYRIKTSLLCDGRAKVSIRLPYPTGKHADDAADWTKPERHTSRIVSQTSHGALIAHTLDSTTYYITLQWEGEASLSETEPHHFTLSAKNDVLTLKATYTQKASETEPAIFVYEQDLKAVIKAWNRWWAEGAIVDFSRCTDPRAAELERRVVLSQYLTQINCANDTPPQETGLTYNSWFGRPHLEMTWWHAVHFALWDRHDKLEKMLEWYNDVAYPKAKEIARRQGFKGIRWMKMTDPWAGEAPSNTGSFLIWQQPHYIYMAEEMYRANPCAETLGRYAQQVEETAEFMADFVILDAATRTYHIKGATAMQESMSKDFSCDHPFELAYWRYGLSVAQTWRERQGLPRNKEWDDIIAHLAPLPECDGIYTAGTPLHPFTSAASDTAFDPFKTPEQKGASSISQEAFEQKSRSDHPAVLGACALIPATMACHSLGQMQKTFDLVRQNWNWDTTWGWDYGMSAMAAARLERQNDAIDMLLTDKKKNRYLVSGHNFQTADRLRLYLPGNGALLTAIAMMCTGWDGCPSVPNPGFPQDGTWNVRWEGLHRMQ